MISLLGKMVKQNIFQRKQTHEEYFMVADKKLNLRYRSVLLISVPECFLNIGVFVLAIFLINIHSIFKNITIIKIN